MSRTGGEKGFEALMRKDPESRRLFVESVRRAPESFAKLYYYNELPFHFLAKDGKKRYVRFRMVPEDGPPEVRLPDEQDQETPWLQQRRPGCTLPKDHLRREFRERLSRGPVVYHVQLRLFEATPDDTEEVFSQVIQWDPKTSPWIDLATVTLDRALSEVETERLRFNFARLAPGLGLIEAHSVYDPNSVSHLRARLYPLGQFVRFMLYKLTKKMPGGKSFKEAEEESRAEIGKPIADRKAEHVEVL
jgi:arachidonate 5-lipoxygenase